MIYVKPIWMVFYADGSTFSSDQGQPNDVPDGPQAIAEHHGGRTMVHTGGEAYEWEASEELRLVRNQGWQARSVYRPGTNIVKLSGTLMSDEAFKTLRAEAIAWLHPVS